MRAYGINLVQVMQAVKNSNIDVGAGTMEINRAEYIIRGLGYVKKLDDLENAPVTSREGIPVRVKDLARVSFGPGDRRGGLDKEGQEAVGGVVVAREGSNPLEVINNVKEKIKEMQTAMPEKTLKDGSVSKVTVVPFYDRETELLDKTLQLMRDEYANGSTSLTDILQTLREKVDYDLLKAEAYAQYNGLVAEMERLAVSRDYSLSKFKER